MKTCSSCKFSVGIEDSPSLLECHRHAIQLGGVDGEGFLVSAFPVCGPYDWCGEFEPPKPAMSYGPSNYAQEW